MVEVNPSVIQIIQIFTSKNKAKFIVSSYIKSETS